MNAKEAVLEIKKKFGDTIVSETEFFGQITLEVTHDHLVETLAFLKNEIQPGYEVLMDLSGVDYLQPIRRTLVIYFLHNPTNFEKIRVSIFVDREGTLPSVTSLWEGADWYERELWDLFGVRFEGHPDFKRILLPDDWVGHPLRKDYALTEESVEFKHGVKPKVPSEIIPHITQIGPYVRDQKRT